MNMDDIPFGVTHWEGVETTEHAGTTGTALWRSQRVTPSRPARLARVEVCW